MILYMRVTEDEYELPLAVADTVGELARICNDKPNNISSCICHAKRRKQRSRYQKVIIQEGEECDF